MKVIIAGSRLCMIPGLLLGAIKDSGFKITEVVSGGAAGVDTMGEMWAEAHQVPIKRFPADWEKYGRAAGPIRNKQMAEYADALIAIKYPNSRGTKNMIEQAKKHNLKVYVKEIKEAT